MAPFNNYCVVCDKLIVPIPNYKFNKLYCSESCQNMDKSILSYHMKNPNKETPSIKECIDQSNSVNDSIITSPLLLPILQDDDSSSSSSTQKQDHIHSYPHLIPTNNIFPKDFMIPNFNDHMAENNYKIWLSTM